MRLLSAFLFSLFITLSLDASYLRSIRVAFESTQLEAEKTLNDVSVYCDNSEIFEMQSEYNFEYKIEKFPNSYGIVIEPISDKDLLQDILDILRLKYKGAYPKKITVPLKEELIEKVNVTEEVETNPEIEDVTQFASEKTIETIIKEEAPQKIEKVQKKIEIEKKIEQVEVLQDDPVYNKSENIWKILLLIVFIAFLISLWFLISARRLNDIYKNRELINNEEVDNIKLEIKNKETLISHVSHELRSPLTSIIGLTHLVLEGELNKLQTDNIKRVESSTLHLLSIVNDILDVSKIQAGKLKIEKSEFNIDNVIDYVLNVITIQARNNKNCIILDIKKDVPSHLIGDSLRLGQILVNLLGNAIKFTKEGEISLGIKTLSDFTDSVKLEFSITDTGIGMSEKEIEKIFKSYTQAEDSTSREYGGTGLGLVISKQLIEMMNGEIRVESKKGVGTTFIFTALFKLKDSQNKRYYRLPSGTMLNKKVLLVDDTDKNIISLTKGLEYFKYTVYKVPSFEEAILDDELNFDLILVNEDKITKIAKEKIEDMRSGNNTKFIVLSTVNTEHQNTLLNDMNVDAYFRIPFTQQGLLNLLIQLYIVKADNSRTTKKLTIKDKLKGMLNKKILVAEDNELNHKVISGLLSQTGIEIIFVENGEAAVNLINRGMHFDMILMDINMPVMNGYDATIAIRKNKKNGDIPIIALTADVMDKSIEKTFNSGMQGHLSKPIVVDTFYQKIYDILKKSNVGTAKNEFKDISVIDYEELSISSGLGISNGDEELYKSILKDFKIMYINSAVTLEELCEDGNFKDARKIAMEIKDISLNIGAYNLCESAATMEYEFEAGSRSNFKKLIELYEITLKKLFLDIDSYLLKN